LEPSTPLAGPSLSLSGTDWKLRYRSVICYLFTIGAPTTTDHTPQPEHDQSEGVPTRTGYLAPVRVCLLVAVGHSGCWIAIAYVVVGVIPRIHQVDILAKILTSQELCKKSSIEKDGGSAARLFA